MGESKIVGVRMSDSLIERIRVYQESQGLSSQSAAILELIETALNKNVKQRKDNVKRFSELRSELMGEFTQAIADLRSELLGKIQERETPAIPLNPGGLTNAQLSQKTGVPKTTIEKWKAKLRAGGSLTGVKLAIAQNLTLTDDGLWILSQETDRQTDRPLSTTNAITVHQTD